MISEAERANALPAEMQVMEMAGRGGPEVLRPGRRPLPTPGPNDVLIRVSAAGLNRADVNHRSGLYTPGGDQSDLLGIEVSGEVVACGSEARMWRVGEEVCAWSPGGGYAEYCIAPEVQVLPVPRGLDHVAAASLPIAYFVAWADIFDLGALKPGESLLVHGGASGVGVAMIQLAAARGHRVFATAGSDERCRSCVELGAEQAINYRTHDFVAEVRRATGGHGVDLIVDMVGGDYVSRGLDVLAFQGRLVLISLLGGDHATVDLQKVVRGRFSIHGAMLRPVSNAFRGEIARKMQAHVWPLIESGAIRAQVHATFPLAEAAEAHRLLESGQQVGKIVLKVR